MHENESREHIKQSRTSAKASQQKSRHKQHSNFLPLCLSKAIWHQFDVAVEKLQTYENEKHMPVVISEAHQKAKKKAKARAPKKAKVRTVAKEKHVIEEKLSMHFMINSRRMRRENSRDKKCLCCCCHLHHTS